jgi:hypothetical protein
MDSFAPLVSSCENKGHEGVNARIHAWARDLPHNAIVNERNASECNRRQTDEGLLWRREVAVCTSPPRFSR